MKITYTDKDQEYARYQELDKNKDGVLDSEAGEIPDNAAAFAQVVAGVRVPVISQPVGTVTPNGKTFPGVIIDIPGGTFEMGSINGQDDEHTSGGKTVTVTMSAFQLAEHETTVGEYKAYLALTGDPTYSKLPYDKENQKGDNFPVVGLTYNEMRAFCEYYGGTLPTSAQIEYASKGGSHFDPYGTPLAKAASYANNFSTTAEVCGPMKERANDFGVCDLAGNVWEATGDGYDEFFYDSMSTTDPSYPIAKSGRIYYEILQAQYMDEFNKDTHIYYEIRGGSVIENDLIHLRSSNRASSSFHAAYRPSLIGFRVAFPPRTSEK